MKTWPRRSPPRPVELAFTRTEATAPTARGGAATPRWRPVSGAGDLDSGLTPSAIPGQPGWGSMTRYPDVNRVGVSPEWHWVPIVCAAVAVAASCGALGQVSHTTPAPTAPAEAS